MSPRSLVRPVARLLRRKSFPPDEINHEIAKSTRFTIRPGTGTAVMRERVGANNEKSDVSGGERLRQIDKVGIHRAIVQEAATVRRTAARPAARVRAAASGARTRRRGGPRRRSMKTDGPSCSRARKAHRQAPRHYSCQAWPICAAVIVGRRFTEEAQA